MGVKWKGGRDIRTLESTLTKRAEYLKSEAREALALSVEEGAVALQDILEDATTKTGERRVKEGGISAGRHDTGNMVGSISHNGDHPRQKNNIMWGDWGWFTGQFEDYFKDQDLGEGDIPAARALAASFRKARESFRARMRRVARGKSARG